MTLRQKQSKFAELFALLVLRALAMGYEVTLGETYRPPATARLYAKQGKGIKNTLHGLKLVGDLNLFRRGRYLRSTRAHRPLGLWWEQQSLPGLVCCWGGRFKDRFGQPKPDGNHYGVAHGGRK